MFFSVGLEIPKDDQTAFGMIVPAFSAYNYGCFSAADTPQEIAPMVREAILMTLEDMAIGEKYAVEDIVDAGHLVYAADPEYADFDTWFLIDIDLSEFEGKAHRINISLPDLLLKRIDNKVKEHPSYRDRSHFIATAARKELLV
ncbi:MAG: type II toxin-antitoxin system HicB family antitoxin [Ewingella americana]|jgi:predicted RNase H-like HicB family nuclease|uniref:type II toxin-antitoxin system HicB family antitoxin n=1 Tax=Ewingella americana TaxID=41202 RepID=UPI000C2FD65A|nr:type II toxin-antitoxin system HicB family antitoxin [Ewingella americana]MCI1677205.1 type II toxin-antitoxin system HicB family antitoxin [Ewingella americana]MCI1853106.1 type II toxin-antitoxin system HicB family antitoxin [Ewingella americana]MCI1860808.1 type II toxin-antitoxin system HicB family antitoxin [Ewingella americana]MCI2144102.1 type II toxin-antitoxin system HicB family antitoxin [Ewingella americana]MCI2165607.1 type II toxin-antitoxin system HicB family antitoxin [Ewinge